MSVPFKTFHAVVLLAFLLATPAVAADSRTLVWNKQIGDVRMQESEAEVGYTYGPDCIHGCPGTKDGCVLGLRDCMGPIYRYKATGGLLRVGYRNKRVVYVETTSPHYRTKRGNGIGSMVPFGPKWGIFRWHKCGPSDGYWIAGTSWKKPLYGDPTHRWWTQVSVLRGRIVDIAMWRGDVNSQEC